MTIAQILNKMIAASNGNIHDIDHLLRVWAYARTIGELEGLDPETQYLLEVAAITHDIACPLCREKYGNTNGKYQEQEGAVLVRSFLACTGMTEAQIVRGPTSWGITTRCRISAAWTTRSSSRRTTSQTHPKTDTASRASCTSWTRS